MSNGDNAKTIRQEARNMFPWMPESLVDVYVDAWIEFGDRQLALQEVRNGDGREVYDQVFPGIRRDDGTLRMNENAYLSTVQSFRNTLQDYSINPELFEDRFAELVQGEVSPREFEQRVDAIQFGILERSAEIRQAFAQASGLSEEDLTDEALLAATIDPDGVGNRMLQREINVAQIRGTAAEFGFERSEADVEEILQARDLNIQQAREFFASAEDRISALNRIRRGFTGDEEEIGIEELEEGVLEQDLEQVSRFERLLQRERAAFGRESRVLTNRSGALRGLRSQR